MAERRNRVLQWQYYDRQTDVAKQRAFDRLILINELEALLDTGMTKSAAVAALASLGNASAASIWNWLGAMSGVCRHDRLAYLVPRFKGGGRSASIERSLLDRLANDYLRPERPSWADCVRRVQVFAESRGTDIPHARTLRRHFFKIYDRPTIALRRGEPLPACLMRHLPANDR